MVQMTDPQVLETLLSRLQKASEVRDNLIVANQWHIYDIRVTPFTKIINAINCTALGFDSMIGYLASTITFPDGTKRDPVSSCYIFELAGYYKIAFVQCVFSATESSLRLLLRALNPTACNNGTAEFKSIYDCLIRTELELSCANDWISMLDLFRLIRNTFHNNGVYFHKSGLNESILYRGARYHFRYGEKIDFVYWDLCKEILDDVIILFSHILAHHRVLSLPQIKDPFAP